MPVHDVVGRITSDEFLRLRRAGFVTMADMDRDAGNFQVDRRPQPRITQLVGVAEDCVHGSDEGEFVEDLVAADVAGVEDELHTFQRFMDLRPDETMRIRDQSETADG